MTEDLLTTRIIVKNLPKWCTEDQIRKFFGVKGIITDVKLMYTRDGQFRRFAFVGFASCSDAVATVKYSDGTFLDTSKVTVELAMPQKSADLKRPWSKYSEGSSLHDAYLERKNASKSSPRDSKAVEKTVENLIKIESERKKKILDSIIDGGEVKDKQMAAYVTAMSSKKGRGGQKNMIWADEDNVIAFEKVKKRVVCEKVPNRKPGGVGQTLQKTRIKFDSDESDDNLYEDLPSQISVNLQDHEDSLEYLSNLEESNFLEGTQEDDLLKDSTIAESKIEASDNKGIESQTSEHIDDTNQGESRFPSASKVHKRIEEDVAADLIMDTGRLFIRNLPYTCTEDDLREVFEPFGRLSEVHLSIAKDTKKPKGFAYVLFMFPEQALRAFLKLDGSIFQGRIMHILPGEEPKEKVNPSSKTSFQGEREKDLKNNAQKSFNWNSLFIRSDTVMDAIAAKLGVTKSSLMCSESDSSSLAARLAVAETNLIQETKLYLEDEGVVLDAFAHRDDVRRSRNIILVKNLPFEVTKDDLLKMFECFGVVGRLVLPPTHAVALVEFAEPSEARTAFRNLAYTRFHHVPLYLEWAPLGSLKAKIKCASTGAIESSSSNSLVGKNNIETSDTRVNIVSQTVDDGFNGLEENICFSKNADQIKNSMSVALAHDGLMKSDANNRSRDGRDQNDLEEDTGILGVNTVYVKNINFSTNEDSLRELFSRVGPVRSVTIPRKPNVNHSLGFAFIEYGDRDSMNRALDELREAVLDGHALILQRSGASKVERNEVSRESRKGLNAADPSNTKIIVRNIPFEASEKELRELFKTFSQLKRVRLPRRFDGRHRGFGFVDFCTHQEAAGAMQVLAHTHLYGRHLVLEWASPADQQCKEGIRDKSAH